MPKYLISSWVKNVNNLRIARGISGDYSSTAYVGIPKIGTQLGEQVVLMQPFIPVFTQSLSTVISTLFDLLKMTYPYYPQYLLLERQKKI